MAVASLPYIVGVSGFAANQLARFQLMLDGMPESGAHEGLAVQQESGWERLYLHGEFADLGGAIANFAEGTALALRGGQLVRLPLPISDAAQSAIAQLQQAYANAGHGFWRFDLSVEADWRYRFTFDQAPSKLLLGQADADARGRLNRYAADYAAEKGLVFAPG